MAGWGCIIRLTFPSCPLSLYIAGASQQLFYGLFRYMAAMAIRKYVSDTVWSSFECKFSKPLLWKTYYTEWMMSIVSTHTVALMSFYLVSSLCSLFYVLSVKWKCMFLSLSLHGRFRIPFGIAKWLVLWLSSTSSSPNLVEQMNDEYKQKLRE